MLLNVVQEKLFIHKFYHLTEVKNKLDVKKKNAIKRKLKKREQKDNNRKHGLKTTSYDKSGEFAEFDTLQDLDIFEKGQRKRRK